MVKNQCINSAWNSSHSHRTKLCPDLKSNHNSTRSQNHSYWYVYPKFSQTEVKCTHVPMTWVATGANRSHTKSISCLVTFYHGNSVHLLRSVPPVLFPHPKTCSRYLTVHQSTNRPSQNLIPALTIGMNMNMSSMSHQCQFIVCRKARWILPFSAYGSPWYRSSLLATAWYIFSGFWM